MKIVGHRGAKGLAPENTIASFEKALEHGVDEIELDVRVSADGQVVLSHDRHLSDPASNELEIATHNFAELKQHKPDLTTLVEVITAVNKRVPIIIEVKPAMPVEPIVEILEKFLRKGWGASDFRLSSYSQPILLALHAWFPNIQKVVIEDWSGVRATRRARQLGSKRISMLEVWLWSGFIRAMHRSGYELYCFPNKTPQKEQFFTRLGLGGFSNTPAKARKWAKHGLAGVITDYPDRFEK